MPDRSIHQLMQAAVEHHRAGRLTEADAGYRLVLAQMPRHPHAMHMLGLIAVANGHPAEASRLIRTAIRWLPENPEAHFNLGVALELAGDLPSAQDAWRQAVQLRPGYAESHFHLGRSYHSQARMQLAADSLKLAIQIDPRNTNAHLLLGSALRELNRVNEAIASFEAAIGIDPSNAEAFSGLGTAFSDQGRLDETLEAQRRSMQLAPGVAKYHSNLICCMHFHPAYTAEMLLQEHRAWNEKYAVPLRASIEPANSKPAANRRLLIGYLSPDLRTHPVGRFMLPVLQHHDANRFEIHCYSTTPHPDGMSDRIRAAASHWHDCATQTDQAIADLIRADGIDILVDLSLHSANNRLLVMARKPAPVQATWLGYPSTTGMDAIDYRLSDAYLDPLPLNPTEGNEVYAEQTLHLPVYWCYPPPAEAPIVADLPSAKRGYITFGSLNNFIKVNDTLLQLWIELLKRVDRSRLLLHSKPGSHLKIALDKMARGGVDPNRITFVSGFAMKDYLLQYAEIDIALDTTPFAGGTTTCDALYMGVPVVTLRGKTAVGRMGAALLSHLQLHELIAENAYQYINIAATLAADTARLSHLRSTLRQRMIGSPLMDAPGFTSALESALLNMQSRGSPRC